jgi:hypothetical protein
VNSGLDDRPPPLLIGGQLWHAPSTEKAEKPAATTTSSDTNHTSP